LNEELKGSAHADFFNSSFGHLEKSRVINTIKRLFQISNGSINIQQFFKTKQTQPELSGNRFFHRIEAALPQRSATPPEEIFSRSVCRGRMCSSPLPRVIESPVLQRT